MSAAKHFFKQEWRRKLGLSVLTLYFAYPELKKIYYDNFKPDSFPHTQHISREKKIYTNEENKQLEREFMDCGFEYFDEPAFKWSKINAWTPSYYWSSDAQYKISNVAADEIAKATFEVHSMCMQAVDFVVRNPELLSTAFDIPKSLHHWIIKSWVERDQDLISRYDFLYREENGKMQLKFIEANADTPTILLEAGLGSEIWAEQQNRQQFNIISQTITQGWKEIVKKRKYDQLVGFSYGVVKDSSFTQKEDKCNVRYLINLADECFQSEDIKLHDVRYLDEYLLGENFKQIDQDYEKNQKLKIDTSKKSLIWKLYPYEWLSQENSNYYFEAQQDNPNIHMLEPAWKLVMANKAILPVLWAMFPENQYLLKSEFDVAIEKYKEAISKRVLGREGKQVVLGSECSSLKEFIRQGSEAGNIYIEEEHNGEDEVFLHPISRTFGRPIFQEYFTAAKFKGRNLTIGSWVVCGLPVGIGLREDVQKITHNDSSFVPHYIEQFNGQYNQGIQAPIDQNQNSQNTQFSSEFDSYSQNLSYQASEKGHIYIPQSLNFSVNPIQKQLRESFYGKNNSISNLYNLFDLKEKQLQTDSQYSFKKISDANIMSNIQLQLSSFEKLLAMSQQTGTRSRSRSSIYLGGSGTSGQVSSAASRNKSFGTRLRTGSSGQRFSSSS